MSYLKQTKPVRIQRLIGIVDDMRNELAFTGMSTEAANSMLVLLKEAHDLLRSLQQVDRSMTLEAD